MEERFHHVGLELCRLSEVSAEGAVDQPIHQTPRCVERARRTTQIAGHQSLEYLTEHFRVHRYVSIGRLIFAERELVLIQ